MENAGEQSSFIKLKKNKTQVHVSRLFCLLKKIYLPVEEGNSTVVCLGFVHSTQKILPPS